MLPTKWGELAQRFNKLKEITGASKSTSYQLQVFFLSDGDIFVELGGYDVGNWPRHTQLGPFKSEEVAIKETEQKIQEAELIVKEEQKEENESGN